MLKNPHFFKVLFSFLLIASIVLANVSIAFADNGVTPEPTPTAEPSEEPADPAAPEATPSPEVEENTAEEEQVSAEGEVPEASLFEKIPSETEVVVLDENGEVIPLASEAALDVILDTDPMWCPAGVLPGGPGCTTNFATISALLTDMRNNTGNYTQDGVIYFTSTPGASFSLTTAASSLGSGDFDTLNDFNLTLQGGWNGANGASATFTGTTNFGSNTLTIGTSANPWVGNISLVNFTFNGVTSGNAITIYTTSGDVSLSNVTISQQGGDNYTAYIDSQSGDIAVQNSTFDGNNSGNNRNRGFHADTNTGSISITNTTFREARDCTFLLFFCLLDVGENSNGATLSAPTVTLNNVTAFNNDLSGIEINNATSVWLNNVVSYDNGTFILILGLGSGVHVNGTGSTIVHVNGGTLSDNEAFGLSVFNGSISVTSDPACSGNRYPGPHPSQCYNITPLDTTPPVLTLPANMIIEAAGPTGAVASFTATANDAVEGSRPVTCAPTSGSTFPLGTTTVNCSASDTSGNIANGSFTVTVQDTILPVLTLPANITTEATGPAGAAVTFSASAADLAAGPLSATCVPASGSTFPLGTTTVNCSASDTSGNTANGSFTVTVQDTTIPVISPHENVFITTSSKTDAYVTFTPPAVTDIVDGISAATCTPASGNRFPLGVTTVICTATDSHGNSAAPVTFLVIVEHEPKTTSNAGGASGGLFDLDCFTVLNVYGVNITFHNLCDHQAVVTESALDNLPGQLPDGAFVKGLTVDILAEGALIKEFSPGSGIQLDFVIPASSQDQYTVFLWDAENKEWLDVTQLMKDEELSKMLTTDTEDELYQIVPTETTKALYRILSTEKTGTFVIVKN